MPIYSEIHRPVLTERERAKRMEAIKKAAVNLVIAAEKERKRTPWTEELKRV